MFVIIQINQKAKSVDFIHNEIWRAILPKNKYKSLLALR